jgi:N-acetylmuramoyl-L-alanine amidase
MTSTRFRLSVSALLLCFLIASPSATHAEKISLRVQFGDQTRSIPGYDSSGVVYVSMRDYAAALSLPSAISTERKKMEVRLPNHRVKATSGSAFFVVTEISSDISSVYQMTHNVFVRDSLYYAPASEFVALLDRLSPLGVTLNAESRSVTKEPVTGDQQFDVTGLSIEQRLNGYLLTIEAPRKLGTFDAFLSHDGWLYVTINDAQADTVSLSRFKGGDAIRRVLVFQSPTSVQLTFQVSADIVQVDPLLDNQSSNLLISLHTRTDLPKEEPVLKKPDPKPKEEVIRETHPPTRNRPKLDVIVIDAGHGGKDPGTIGITGTREKDVALGVALKLGQLIKQSLNDVRVVYTRHDDTFVELRNRTTIANDAGGKLFISIHCNSTERKPSSANGFEIYILRPGKTENAIRIAEKENDAIKFEDDYKNRYQELNEENFILITMRQSAFVRYSEEFAEKASDAMANLLKIQNSGVKQAGFLVLVGASMPNVLVETGYLSNRQEEKILRSQEGQRKIAEALLEGIKQYKEKYEEAPQENRARGSKGH